MMIERMRNWTIFNMRGERKLSEQCSENGSVPVILQEKYARLT